MRTALTVAASAAALTTMGIGALGIVIGRRVVLPSSPRTVRVFDIDDSTLTLEATRQTTHPGTFGIWFGPTGHAVIDAIVRSEPAAGTITRQVSRVTGGDLRTADRVRWTGHVYPDAQSLHPDARDVDIPVDGGTAPAWLIPSYQAGDGHTWAIHVHGIRTTRLTALRSVPAAQQAGYTSLVISYRGDGEGPPVPRNASTLGQTEWRDVDAAISYALDHGAQTVVLFGWSMGASPVLLTTEHSPHRDRVRAVVLIDPVTEWRTAIRAGAARAHLPEALGSLAAAILSTPHLSRAAGLAAPIDLQELDWTRPRHLTTPCLVIHSPGDTEIPLALSRRFAAAHPETVDLTEFPAAAHAWEYNVDPDTFNRAVTTWLATHALTPSPRNTAR